MTLEKALDLVDKADYEDFGDCKYYVSQNEVNDIIKLIFEDYKIELEEAMKPKSCDGCKYEGQGRYRAPCEYCSRTLWDEYEPKGTK